jgi:asparagine synthase (glutamine-hydrolysing)
MRRFLAVLWQSDRQPTTIPAALRLARSTGMRSVCHVPGMMLAVNDIETLTFDASSCGMAGAVVGDVHYRHGPSDVRVDAPAETERLVQACRSGELAKQCWGSFLALQQRSDDGSSEAYHSPFSSLPVYYATLPGAVVLASDAALLKALGESPCTIDWGSIAIQIAYDDFAFRSTCITGIRELRCGQALQWRRDHSPIVRSIWNPWAHAATDEWFDDEAAALERLEREMVRCTAARIHGLASPLLDLSGGLDSSVLAALISKNGIDVQAVNMFSPATEGDERSFARAVADHLGIALTEAAPQADLVDIRRCASPHLPRPHARSFVQEIDRLTLAATSHTAAFINGGGGDAVFCHLQSSGPAVDVLRSPGSAAGFLRTVHEIAATAQVSFWVALRKALAKTTRSTSRVKLVGNPKFLSGDVIAAPSGDELPWPPPPRGVLPGKLEHVRGIYSSCFNMQGFARSSNMKAVFPLLSQPLVETCLRIPTWMWLAQGHDRYLARKIAGKWLPSQVAWRRSKGGLGQLQRDIYRLNKLAVREMLLDGVLQANGIIDRAAIEAQMVPGSELRSDQFPRLLRLCDFEAWALHWS